MRNIPFGAAPENAAGRLDVVVHNAGYMSYGPAEAFTPEQFAQFYDINVLSTQRVNRAALPQLRKQGRGLVVWVSSSSVRGGTPPISRPKPPVQRPGLFFHNSPIFMRPLSPVTYALLRIALGATMVTHGWPKITGTARGTQILRKNITVMRPSCFYFQFEDRWRACQSSALFSLLIPPQYEAQRVPHAQRRI
jgi:NAD(P)-dependent dehydrogenase (short-subunit alcohol dehydrogenase family)